MMDEIISYKMCAVKVRNAKLRNYLKETLFKHTLYSKLCHFHHTVQSLFDLSFFKGGGGGGGGKPSQERQGSGMKIFKQLS